MKKGSIDSWNDSAYTNTSKYYYSTFIPRFFGVKLTNIVKIFYNDVTITKKVLSKLGKKIAYSSSSWFN